MNGIVVQRFVKLKNLLDLDDDDHHANLYILCRRGRDAAKATKALNTLLSEFNGQCTISCFSILGGLKALVNDVPELLQFPFL